MTHQPTNTNNSSNPVNRRLILWPDCMDFLFMLPFPFFCVGCWSCVNVTACINFDSASKNLRVTSYPGLLFCCPKQCDMPLSEVQTCTVMVPKCKVNKKPAYEVRIESIEGSIVLTGAKEHSVAGRDRAKVEEFLSKCRRDYNLN